MRSVISAAAGRGDVWFSPSAKDRTSPGGAYRHLCGAAIDASTAGETSAVTTLAILTASASGEARTDVGIRGSAIWV